MNGIRMVAPSLFAAVSEMQALRDSVEATTTGEGTRDFGRLAGKTEEQHRKYDPEALRELSDFLRASKAWIPGTAAPPTSQDKPGLDENAAHGRVHLGRDGPWTETLSTMILLRRAAK